MTEPIKIRGLKQNNLKNISLDIPKNKIVVYRANQKNKSKSHSSNHPNSYYVFTTTHGNDLPYFAPFRILVTELGANKPL